MKKIPYGRQFIEDTDKESVLKVLSNNLITTGPEVQKFEKKIKKYLKCKYSYVCSSGTAAIHLALLSAGLKKNDTILMPAINFIASYNMSKNMGLKIYLIDVDENTGQITPNKILECIKKNKLKKINALIVMYHGGYPLYANHFYKLKKKYNFFLIEDSCHALGSEYKSGKAYYKIGSCKHSDISTFSLHPLKSITSGEGGIVTTNNAMIAKNINLYRSHGISRSKSNYWTYDVIKNGYNYRLSDINCALGSSQLNKISLFLKKRSFVYKKYFNELNNFNTNLIIPQYPKTIKPSFHLFLININFNNLKTNKDHFLKYLVRHNILAQQHYIPIYKFKIYKEKKYNYLGSNKYFDNSVSIPIFVNLKVQQQNKIIKTIKNYFKR